MCRKFMTVLLSIQAESDDDDEDAGKLQSNQNLQKVHIRKKLSNKNMFDVVSWYKQQYQVWFSPVHVLSRWLLSRKSL